MENANNYEVKIVVFHATDRGTKSGAEAEIATYLNRGYKIHSIVGLGDTTMCQVTLVKSPKSIIERGYLDY